MSGTAVDNMKFIKNKKLRKKNCPERSFEHPGDWKAGR